MALVGDSISRMPGPPFGPSLRITITCTFLHRAVEDGFKRLFLGLKHHGLAGKTQAFLSTDFRHGAFGRKIAAQDDEVTVLFDRLIERLDDGLTCRIRFHAGKCLRHRPPGHRQRVAVEQSFVQQRLHQGPDAANGHEFRHQMFSAGFQVREHRHAFADAREVVQGQLHLCRMGDGEQVQHGIGRTAEGDDDGDGVLERFPG